MEMLILRNGKCSFMTKLLVTRYYDFKQALRLMKKRSVILSLRLNSKSGTDARRWKSNIHLKYAKHDKGKPFNLLFKETPMSIGPLSEIESRTRVESRRIDMNLERTSTERLREETLMRQNTRTSANFYLL